MRSDFLNTLSTQCAESLASKPREVIKAPSEPEPSFGVRDAVVKDDRNSQNILHTNGNQARVPNVPAQQFQGRPPHNTLPQPDPPIFHHPGKSRVTRVSLDRSLTSPLLAVSRPPAIRKKGTPERLNSFLLSMFKPSGKTQTSVISGSPLNQPGMYNHPKSRSRNAGGIFQLASELMPSPDPPPLSLTEIISESRKRPDQDLIDRVDRV